MFARLCSKVLHSSSPVSGTCNAEDINPLLSTGLPSRPCICQSYSTTKPHLYARSHLSSDGSASTLIGLSRPTEGDASSLSRKYQLALHHLVEAENKLQNAERETAEQHALNQTLLAQSAASQASHSRPSPCISNSPRNTRFSTRTFGGYATTRPITPVAVPTTHSLHSAKHSSESLVNNTPFTSTPDLSPELPLGPGAQDGPSLEQLSTEIIYIREAMTDQAQVIAWQGRVREQALAEMNAQVDSLGESLHAAQFQIRTLQDVVASLQEVLVQDREARLNASAAREEKRALDEGLKETRHATKPGFCHNAPSNGDPASKSMFASQAAAKFPAERRFGDNSASSGSVTLAHNPSHRSRVCGTNALMFESILDEEEPTSSIPETRLAQDRIQSLNAVEYLADSVRRLITEFYEQKLQRTSPDDPSYAPLLHRLRALCRTTQSLPVCYTLKPDEVAMLSRYPIASSAMSDVYRGKRGHQIVAIKSLRLHVESPEKVHRAFHNEAVMWKFLKHEHIVPFIGVSPLFPVCLISEWMPHGSVSSFLRTHPCADRIRFLREIVSGLKYMHSMDVIHGDLKASNILVDAEHHVRLTDFGLSTILFGTGSLTNTGSPAGTVRWMAPERLRDSEDSHPSVRSDIYALGMVIYELFSGRIPFAEERNPHGIILRIVSGERPPRPDRAEELGLTDKLWAITKLCWQDTPARRPTLQEIVARCPAPASA